MARWRVEIVRKAEKEYLSLPPDVKKRIRSRIFSLESNPRPPGSKKLKETDYYRLRSGITGSSTAFTPRTNLSGFCP